MFKPNPHISFFFFYFFKFYFIFKLYIIVLVLPNIKMNPPQVYMCSPSWALLPPPSPYHPSGSSQCTSPKHPVSCIEPGLCTLYSYELKHNKDYLHHPLRIQVYWQTWNWYHGFGEKFQLYLYFYSIYCNQ